MNGLACARELSCRIISSAYLAIPDEDRTSMDEKAFLEVALEPASNTRNLH